MTKRVGLTGMHVLVKSCLMQTKVVRFSITIHSFPEDTCLYAVVLASKSLRIMTVNRRPRLLHLPSTGKQGTLKNPRTSRKVILVPWSGLVSKIGNILNISDKKRLHCSIQSGQRPEKSVVKRNRAI